jgi:hypothetical protein
MPWLFNVDRLWTEVAPADGGRHCEQQLVGVRARGAQQPLTANASALPAQTVGSLTETLAHESGDNFPATKLEHSDTCAAVPVHALCGLTQFKHLPLHVHQSSEFAIGLLGSTCSPDAVPAHPAPGNVPLRTTDARGRQTSGKDERQRGHVVALGLTHSGLEALWCPAGRHHLSHPHQDQHGADAHRGTTAMLSPDTA